MTRLKCHPLTELFPEMPESEYLDLVNDIGEKGQLNPIVLGPDGRIIDGRHRYRALCDLGIEDQVEVEQLPENISDEELASLVVGYNVRRRHLYPSQCAMAAARIVPHLPGRRADAKRAAATQMKISDDLVSKAMRILNNAHAAVVAAVDAGAISIRDALSCLNLPIDDQARVINAVAAGESKSVREATKRLKREQQVEILRTAETPSGEFRCIVATPPWQFGLAGSTMERPTMSVNALCEYVVPAAEDCVLWLWTTNARLEDAYTIVRAWDFRPEHLLTWVRPRMGTITGRIRNQTEHCILATKGSPVTAEPTQSSNLIHGPVRPRGEKPPAFFEMVEKLCPGPHCFLFAKHTREGWVSFGDRIESAATSPPVQDEVDPMAWTG